MSFLQGALPKLALSIFTKPAKSWPKILEVLTFSRDSAFGPFFPGQLVFTSGGFGGTTHLNGQDLVQISGSCRFFVA